MGFQFEAQRQNKKHAVKRIAYNNRFCLGGYCDANYFLGKTVYLLQSKLVDRMKLVGAVKC